MCSHYTWQDTGPTSQPPLPDTHQPHPPPLFLAGSHGWIHCTCPVSAIPNHPTISALSSQSPSHPILSLPPRQCPAAPGASSSIHRFLAHRSPHPPASGCWLRCRLFFIQLSGHFYCGTYGGGRGLPRKIVFICYTCCFNECSRTRCVRCSMSRMWTRCYRFNISSGL